MKRYSSILNEEPIGCSDQLRAGYERKKGSSFWNSATVRKEFLVIHMGKIILAKYCCITMRNGPIRCLYEYK